MQVHEWMRRLKNLGFLRQAEKTRRETSTQTLCCRRRTPSEASPRGTRNVMEHHVHACPLSSQLPATLFLREDSKQLRRRSQSERERLVGEPLPGKSVQHPGPVRPPLPQRLAKARGVRPPRRTSSQGVHEHSIRRAEGK